MRRAQLCLRRTAAIGLALGLLPLSALAGDAAADPPPVRCDKKNAKAAYEAAVQMYGSRKCGEAIPGLEEAAALCPVPPKDLWTVSKGFATYPYVPFFYLGNCHYQKSDVPKALRHFYLSSCVGEPARDKEITEDLGDLTDKCLLRMKREGALSHFSVGFKASGNGQWKKSAEKMWDALLIREEDGETTNSSGRWPDPYLPRFHLADALFELGCPQQACEELSRSTLKKLREKRVEPERKRMEERLTLCEPKRLASQKEEEVCRQWRCWLQESAR